MVKMRIVVVSDIHGDIENMLMYLDKIKELKFDVAVCPGDFTDINTPRGFGQEEVARLIVEELKTLKKPVIAVPGNVDTKDIIEILKKEGVSVHGSGMIVNGFGFYGYGGAKTPFGTNIEPSEEEMGLGLNNAWKDIKNTKYKIQITHAPPSGTRLDTIQSGVHVGSDVIKNFIETHQPILAVSAHIHEARGIDRLKDTFLINAGRFSEGYFGLINIENGSVNGKILNLIE